ncbi:MAG: EpsG family protein [Bacteroidota bacterium]|nr:EpsG family protein [Bacteroidota bacterium]
MVIYLLLFFLVVIVSVVLTSSSLTLGKNKGEVAERALIAMSFLVILSFIGFRYNVGRDFLGYWGDYKKVDFNDFGEAFSFYKYEYGYYALLEVGRFFNMGPQSVFLLSSVLSLWFYFNLFKKRRELLPASLFVFFFATPYLFMINGLRQTIAVFAFLNALNSLTEGSHIKRTICFIFWCLVGFLFHNSIAFFLPCVFLQFDSLLSKINSKVLILIALSGFLLNVFGISKDLIPDAELLGTEGYSYGTAFDNDRFNMDESVLSIGNLFQLALFLIPFLFYDRINRCYPLLKVFFFSFAVGVAVFFMFSDNMFTQRVSYYFLFSELLVYPSLCVFCKRKKGFNWWHVCVIMIIFLYIYTLPAFFNSQLWPGASIWGISLY